MEGADVSVSALSQLGEMEEEKHFDDGTRYCGSGRK
jgi:hypothetical protein